MEILTTIMRICCALTICTVSAQELNQLPAELRMQIIGQAGSIDDARAIITKLDATNTTFHRFVRNSSHIGLIIKELTTSMQKSFPFVACMLAAKSPTWLQNLIKEWLTSYAAQAPQTIQQQTIQAINEWYLLDPQVKDAALVNLINQCVSMLIKAGITLKDTDQQQLIDGKGIQLLTKLFTPGRDHIELASSLVELGVVINYSFKLEQAVIWYDKQERGQQRQKVKPFMQLLAKKGGCLKSPQAITINEMNQLGLPICPE